MRSGTLVAPFVFERVRVALNERVTKRFPGGAQCERASVGQRTSRRSSMSASHNWTRTQLDYALQCGALQRSAEMHAVCVAHNFGGQMSPQRRATHKSRTQLSQSFDYLLPASGSLSRLCLPPLRDAIERRNRQHPKSRDRFRGGGRRLRAILATPLSLCFFILLLLCAPPARCEIAARTIGGQIACKTNKSKRKDETGKICQTSVA